MLSGIDDAIEYSPNPLGQQIDRSAATQIRAPAHLAARKKQQARRQEVYQPQRCHSSQSRDCLIIVFSPHIVVLRLFRLLHEPLSYVVRRLGLSICSSASYTHTLTITCTCCYDEIKGTQDLKIYSHADSLILSLD